MMSLLSRIWARRWAVVGLALAVLVFFKMLLPLWLGPVVAVQRVARTDVVRTLVATGRIQTPFRGDIGSQITGTVARIPVAEGQTVKAGELLIQLEDREARAGLAQADAALAQAKARLEQMTQVSQPLAEQALQQAEATLLNTRQQYERLEKLRANGFATQAQIDEARKGLDIATAQARSARVQVLNTKPGGSEFTVAQTSLRQAEAALNTAKARLEYTTIEAPVDGVLIARNVEKGDVVQPGRALMVLSPFGETQVVVQVDEKNLGLLRLGQPALVSADAYPDQRFAAELVYINPSIDPQRASVQVKLKVMQPPDYLRQDMTVSVDIETARSANALVVPLAALRGLDTGKPSVLVVERGRARERAVRLGLRGQSMVEILSGVGEGDAVIVGNSAITADASVRSGS